jgi:hypothetical protein
MTLKKITEGPHKGSYLGEHGVIYNEGLARKKFPTEFKAPPKKKAVKKSAKRDK